MDGHDTLLIPKGNGLKLQKKEKIRVIHNNEDYWNHEDDEDDNVFRKEQ